MVEAQESQVGGEIQLDDSVLDRIASIAVTEVDGVHSIGRTGIGGALDSVRGGGVSSEHGQHEAAFDFDLVVVWGYNIPKVVGAVRSSVTEAILNMTDLKTVEVNIHVRDVYSGKQVASGRKLQ